jgi:predicted ester cyclase
MKNSLKLLPLLIICSFVLFSCQQQDHMQNNTIKDKTAAMKIYEIIETGNADSLGNYIADDAVDHALDTTITKKLGLAGIKEELTAYHTSFPDIKFTINAMAEAGDTLWAYYTWTGTNTGPMMGMPPTNKSVSVNGVDITRFQNGKAVEHWEVEDDLGFMKQMGMMPAPAKVDSKNMKKKKM